MDTSAAGQRGGRLRDQAGLLRRVTPRGADLLGAQRPDVAAQLKSLDQKPDRIA